MRRTGSGRVPWILVVVFGALAVGLAAAAVQYQGRLEALNRSDAQATLLGVAELKAERISAWLQERRADAALLSMVAWTPGEGSQLPMTPQEEARLGSSLESIVGGGVYSSAVVVRPDGRIVAQRPEPGPRDPRVLQEWVAQAMAGVAVSELRADADGAVHLQVLAPLLDADGALWAIIALRAELARGILPLLESWPTPSTSAESLFVRREGDEVVFLSRTRHLSSPARLLRRPLSERWLPAVQAVLGREGPLEGRDYRGVPVLAAARLVPGTGWAVVAKIDVEEVLAPARLRGWTVLATGGAILLLGAVVVMGWSWRRDRAAAERQTAVERRAQEALRASERRLEATLDSIGDAVISTDGAGAVVRLNLAAERMLGMRLAEARGRPLAEVCSMVDEQTGQRVRFAEPASLHGGEASATSRHLVLLRNDDGRRPVTGTVAPIRNLAGADTGAVLILRDVTQEREAQRAAESRAKLFLCVSDALLALGPDRRIRDWNPAAERMFGWTSEEARGQGLELLATEYPLNLPRESFFRALDATGHAQVKVAQHRRDGRRLSVEKTAAVIREADGCVGGYVVSCRDVTEREQLLTRLALADRIASVSTLAAGVAHEINNPLAVVSANLAWCRQQLAGSTPDLEALSTVLGETEAGATRIQQTVLALGTFSQERRSEAASTDVAEAVKTAISMASNQLKHCAQLELDLEAVPPVVGSPHQLGQVLLNVLVNAAQAIPAGAVSENRVRVSARQRPDGLVAIEISDTGAGIPSDILPRIFDPFFTTKAFGDGAGLGLPISHGIVNSLGGRIEVEAHQPRGTTVRVLLPQAKEVTARPADVAPVRAPVSAPVSAATTTRARVLVVDDEPFICKMMLRVLEPHHDAAAVHSGAEALARLREQPYDLILCDLMMPEMTGMELHRALPAELAARMVFLTGGAFTPEAQAFLDQQGHRCLLKPFKPKELLETVAAALVGAAPEARGAAPTSILAPR